MSEGYILKKTEKSLPLNWYFNQKQFDKEISKVLSKEWLYVCHVDTISKPLSFHTVSTWLLTRKPNNEISSLLLFFP